MARGRRRGSRAGNANSKRRFGGRDQTRHATATSVAASCASSSSSSHLRPRRGPPAIFVTCEAGREHKCKREVLELLHHYYYASRGAINDDIEHTEKDSTLSNAASSSSTTTTTETTATVSSSLTLEEELAMLRKGAAAEEVLSYQPISKRPRIDNDGGDVDHDDDAMKSPFAIYDTGMRGMICILCTLPQCEYIPYDEILMQLRNSKEDSNNNKIEGMPSCTSKNDAIVCNDNDADEQTASVSASAAVAAAASIDDNKKQSLNEESGEAVNQNIETPSPPPILWDPVQTVKSILSDAKRKRMSSDEEESGKKNTTNSTSIVNIESSGNETFTSPPGSRFISRILPMQATCYASVEEIKAVTLALLRRCLPDILRSIQSKRHAAAAAAGGDGGDNDLNVGGGGGGSSKTNPTNITFKLEIKRRLCTHLTRDGIIEAVTPLLLDAGGAGEDGALGGTNYGRGGLRALPPGCKASFSVNLTDPDFSIRIETCKALVGVSILPREDWYGNFNLAEINDPDNKCEK